MGASRAPSTDRPVDQVRSLPAVIARGVGSILLLPVWLWRSTAALRTPRCRYYPSCSTYAVASVRGHGPLRGSVLAARRVGRCHPWSAGGVDHVPAPTERSAWRRRHTGSCAPSA